MRHTDANSSIRCICGDPAVQSNIVGAVNITSGWTFNTATADFMGNLFADDVYIKTNGALRSNHIAPNGGTLVTIDTNLAVQNAHLATNTIQSFDLATVSFLDNISMTTGTDILMGTSEISTYYDGTNLSTFDIIFKPSNTAFRIADSSTTPSVLLSIDKTFGTRVNTESFTNNAPSTFNENVTVVNTKTLFVNSPHLCVGFLLLPLVVRAPRLLLLLLPPSLLITVSLTLTHAHSHSLTHTHSLTLTHSHSLTLTHSHSLTHTHSLTLTHTHSLTLSHSHSLTLTHSHSLTLTHSLTHAHSHSLTHSLTLTLIHSLSFTHSLTHSLAHSLTHTR